MYNPKLHFHFTGIGGSGMSGIAEILLRMGFRVSGSDLKKSAVSLRLESIGAKVCEGHSALNVPASTSVLVYSSAVGSDNPELVEAAHRGIPVLRRAEVLAELMRLKFGIAVAGSHGKTSTTSLIAAVLEEGALDPTVIIGGVVKSIGTGGKLGRGDLLVAESDESDRSFLLLKPSVAVVTNIDAEHMDAYDSLADLEQSFEQFATSVPFYGLAVLCSDDPKVASLAQRFRGRKVTYGFSQQAQLRAQNLQPHSTGISFDVALDDVFLAHVDLPMFGAHFALNALAAIAVGMEFGVSIEKIVSAFAHFEGVGRRIERVGEVSGVTVFTDYGHHPTEVSATLKALRTSFSGTMRRFHVLFQPHRYTRTRDCFEQFIGAFRDCDRLIVTEIYSAGQKPIEGVSGQHLCDAIEHKDKHFVASLDDCIGATLAAAQPGDLVLCLGAGSVGTLPDRILRSLEEATPTPASAGNDTHYSRPL